MYMSGVKNVHVANMCLAQQQQQLRQQGLAAQRMPLQSVQQPNAQLRHLLISQQVGAFVVVVSVISTSQVCKSRKSCFHLFIVQCFLTLVIVSLSLPPTQCTHIVNDKLIIDL